MGNKCSRASKLQRERDEAEDLEAKLADEARFAEAVNNIREEKEQQAVQKLESQTDVKEDEGEYESGRSEKSLKDMQSSRSSREIVLEKQQSAQKEFERMKKEELERMESATLVKLDKADSNVSVTDKTITQPVPEGTTLVEKKEEETEGKLEMSTLFNMGGLDKATTLIGKKYGCSLGPGHVTSDCPICSTYDLSDAPLLS